MTDDVDTVTLFNRSSDEWLRERRSALQEAATRADPRRELPEGEVRARAFKVIEPFQLQLPRLVPGDRGVRLQVLETAAGPHPDDEPQRRVRVSLLVEGDASLLCLRPSNPASGPGSLPGGQVVGGAVVADFPWPLRRDHVEAYREVVAANLERLRTELSIQWTAALLMAVLNSWKDRRAAEAAARARRGKAARELSSLGYPVEG